ncbi:MAG: YraN family protein [Gemmatimonadaceae bacterium]|nr:YraN family protein [Gemmatimonadaceae bacterium]
MQAELRPIPPYVLLIVALAALAFAAWLALAVRRWWKAQILAERMDRAASGERRAERWLEAQGYRVLQRQLSKRSLMHIDGRVAEYDVRADLLVQMGDERVIVEVKTGEAADPRLPATRRQLREYAAVFGVERVFLFDASRDRLHRVEFPETLAE